MDEILDLNINDMAQTEFECSCGRTHNFSIHDVSIGPGAIEDLVGILEPFKDSKILMISDNNTEEVAGKHAKEILKEAGFNVKPVVFDYGDRMLIPDESVVGTVLEELDLDVGAIVAVGSGSLNDTAKFISSRTGVPYIIVGTAPSMDGYVSDGAPLMNHGKKISYPAGLAYGVIGDTEIMKDAPERMIQSGFGDVLGKATALTDWDLSVNINDEYRCPTCVTLVERALNNCIDTAEQLANRDKDAVKYLMEALTLTGVAMALAGVSRPASGAEHMISHYWEMDFINRGLDPEFHGIKVGIGTYIIARVFEMIEDILPETTKELSKEWNSKRVKELLETVGCPVSPAEIGIDKELFQETMRNAYTVRPRYSVLEYAIKNGRMDEIIEELTQEFYPED